MLRKFHVVLFLVTIGTGLFPLGGFGETLQIMLGDDGQFRGRVLGMEDGHLHLQPVWSGNPTLVPWDSVRGMVAPARGESGNEHSHARVWLANGDRLSGKPLGFDGRWLDWETRTGSVLRLKWEAVENLEFFPGPGETLDLGTGLMDHWETVNFRGRDEPLLAIGGGLIFPPAQNMALGRKLPRVNQPFAIELRLETESASFGYGFMLFGENPLQLPLGGVTVNVGNVNINSQYRSQNPEDRSPWMGETRVEPGEPHVYRFFVDPVERNKIWMYLNGRRVTEWELRQDLTGGGAPPMFCFRVHQLHQPMLLSDYRVYAWNGKLPPASPPEPKKDQDLVLLRDGTLHAGHWVSLKNDRLHFALEDDETTIPLDKVARILPPGRRPSRPEEADGSMYLRFQHNRDRVTFADVDILDGGVRGTSAAWEGHLKVPWSELLLLRRRAIP